MERRRRESWPRFDSALLERVADALGRRWKRIHDRSFQRACERSTGDEAGEASERLDIDVHLSEDRPARLRLGIWDDAALWLGVQLPGTRTWMEFQGTVRSVSPEEIVARFESTISTVAGEYGSGSSETELTAIWDKAALRRKKPG